MEIDPQEKTKIKLLTVLAIAFAIFLIALVGMWLGLPNIAAKGATMRAPGHMAPGARPPVAGAR